MRIKGIGGEGIPYVVKEVALSFTGYKFNARIGWALIEEVPLLLGRLDIFRRFKIVFYEGSQIVAFIPKK